MATKTTTTTSPIDSSDICVATSSPDGKKLWESRYDKYTTLVMMALRPPGCLSSLVHEAPLSQDSFLNWRNHFVYAKKAVEFYKCLEDLKLYSDSRLALKTLPRLPVLPNPPFHPGLGSREQLWEDRQRLKILLKNIGMKNTTILFDVYTHALDFFNSLLEVPTIDKNDLVKVSCFYDWFAIVQTLAELPPSINPETLIKKK
jgi:hypothetical protein